ncbi:hypothetical protein NKDENANG_01798 [Candidatus Entotheonellaceae bacterium PAL068K]
MVLLPSFIIFATLLAHPPSVVSMYKDPVNTAHGERESCSGRCRDGFWSHSGKYKEGENIACGVVAAANLLANLGCKIWQGRWEAKGRLPIWGSTPSRVERIVNIHLRGPGCAWVPHVSIRARSKDEYLRILEDVTRQGRTAAALILPPDNGKTLHWVVVGMVQRNARSCKLTYYDQGFREQIACKHFLEWAAKGYFWPFVNEFSLVVPKS